MVTPDRYAEILEQLLLFHTQIPYNYGDIKTTLVISLNRDQFILMDHGWENNRRVHGCLFHAQIINQKIAIEYDGIEDSITEDLVSAGIPKEDIILAFHPPAMRQYTGYAMA
ncbi:MAG: XisI protein [Prochlorotrichaceae cyanobacterium]|jgi:hypothetical protein